MNPRVTVGLLVVLVALAAFVYYGPAGGPASTPGAGPGGGPAAKTTPTPQLDIWQIQEQQIQSVTVQLGGRTGGVERAGDEWTILPSGEAADRLRVNSMMFRIASLRATRRLSEPANLAEFGLTSPSLVATVRLTDGSTQSLQLGGKAPAESGSYAQRVGDPTVYVVSTALAQDLERLVTEPPRVASPVPSPDPAASPSPVP